VLPQVSPVFNQLQSISKLSLHRLPLIPLGYNSAPTKSWTPSALAVYPRDALADSRNLPTLPRIYRRKERGQARQNRRSEARGGTRRRRSTRQEGSNLRDFSKKFLEWVDAAKLEQKTKAYYKDGWRLLSSTTLTGMRLNLITSDQVERLSFSGSSANTNCALRTLRRMLHRAEDWKLIQRAPKLKLEKEYGRSLRLDEEIEKKLIAGAAACNWKKDIFERFRDVVILMRDTGMRNERELYHIRLEHLHWDDRTIFVPDSKTGEGRRRVPMSERAFKLLRARCGTRTEGWLFPANRGKTGHLTTLAARFREARKKAGISPNMVLYCGRLRLRHAMMERTGNLKAVMKVMRHRDVKTAMKYQHPVLEIVRAALDQSSKGSEASA